MAKPSSKKVSRAARTSGGRTARGATPWGWYSAMALIVALGSLGVYQSRDQRIHAASKGGGERPKVGDHWHAAIGVYECDHFTANIRDSGRDPLGIHTHGDGIVHIHPFQKPAAGKNATLKVFFDTVGAKINATSFRLPGESKTFRDGEKCNGKPGTITFYVNGKKRTGNSATYRPKDRDQLVLAFAAKGVSVPLVPPSAPNLNKLTDVPSASTSTTEGQGGPGATPTSSPPPSTPPESSTTATTKAP
jgi:hypothetical protein